MSTTNGTDELVAVLHRYEAAFNGNDVDAMNALFTEDSTFVNFSGVLVIGREELRRAQAFVFTAGGPLADVRVSYTAEHVAVLGGDHAVVHARQRTQSVAPASPDPMEAVFTAVLVRTPDGWRIRSGQNTPVM